MKKKQEKNLSLAGGKMKHIVAMLLTFIMCFTMAVPAFAASGSVPIEYGESAIANIGDSDVQLVYMEQKYINSISTTSPNLIVYDVGEVIHDNGRSDNKGVYYHGPISYGNVINRDNGDFVKNNIQGTITIKYKNNVIMSDGSIKDSIITVSNISLDVGKASNTSFDTSKDVNCILIRTTPSEFWSHVGAFRTDLDWSNTNAQLSPQAKVGARMNIKFTIVEPGTTTPVSCKFNTKFCDIDIKDNTLQPPTFPNVTNVYQGTDFAEGIEMNNGFNNTAMPQKTNNSNPFEKSYLSIDNINGNKKFVGNGTVYTELNTIISPNGTATYNEEGTMYSGVVANVNNGFDYYWTGSYTTASYGSIGTALNFASVPIKATSGEGGTIEKKGTTNYLLGSSTTYNYTPEEGYKVASLKVDGKDVSFDKNGGTYKFSNIYKDIIEKKDANTGKIIDGGNNNFYTIDVQFIPKDYEVTYVSDNGGNITGKTDERKDPDEITTGSEQEPKDMYRFAHWIADIDVTLKDGTTIPQGEPLTDEQIKNVVVNSDIEFTAIHEKLWNVYYVSDEGGTIVGKEAEIRAESENPTNSSQQPNEGWQFTTWTVEQAVMTTDGKEYPAGSTIPDEDIEKVIVDKDITFTAHHELIPALKIEKTADKDTYNVDEEITYTLVVSQEVEGASAKDVHVIDSLPLGVSLVKGPFVEGVEDYAINDEEGIDISLGDISDQIVTITYTVKVNKEDVDSSEVLNTAVASCTNGEPVDDTETVERMLKVKTKVINGKITDSSDVIPVGSSYPVSYEPNEGYELLGITVNGISVDLTKYPNGFPFENLKDNQEIEVIYSPIKYQITTEVENGNISPDKIVQYGDNTIVTYEPLEGFRLVSITVDGKDVDITKYPTSYPFENIKDNHHVKVIYEAIPEPEPEEPSEDTPEAPAEYMVNTKVVNGNITPSTTVDEHGNVTINYSPKEGYILKTVKVNGQEIDITKYPNSYTFSDITSNQDIEVVYEKVEETPTATPESPTTEVPTTEVPTTEKPIQKPTQPATKAQAATTPTQITKTTPKTGDNTNIWLWGVLAVAALGGAGTAVIISKKRSKTEEK